MWRSRTKADLIIEVWEKLDCESVGAREIIEIENAVRAQFGPAAVESPMVLARQLADEGAELRHAEIMNLYLERVSENSYEHIFRNVLKVDDLRSAAATIRRLEGIRKKFENENDSEGLRVLRETALRGKDDLLQTSRRRKADKEMNAEMISWLTIWLQSPDVFENWLMLRIRSEDFRERFGDQFQV